MNYYGRTFFYIGELDQSEAFLEESSKINKKLGDIQGFIRANDSLSKTLFTKAKALTSENASDDKTDKISNLLINSLEHAYISFSESSYYSKIPEQAFALESFLRAYNLLASIINDNKETKTANNKLKEIISNFESDLQKVESKRIFNKEQLEELIIEIKDATEGIKLMDILKHNF